MAKKAAKPTKPSQKAGERTDPLLERAERIHQDVQKTIRQTQNIEAAETATPNKRGPKPEVLRLEGNWTASIRKNVQKEKPPRG